MASTSISKSFRIISMFFTLRLYNSRSMNALIFFSVTLAEVQVAVLSVLNLPRQGFLATCQIGHSPLLFLQRMNKITRWLTCCVAWKPKMLDDVMPNDVFWSLFMVCC